MTLTARSLRGALTALALFGCAPSRPAAYSEAETGATRAYAAGRYTEAAELWTRAESAAQTFHDRSEALSRSASAWQRAGQPAKATRVCQRLIQSGRATEAVARCAYDNARRALLHDVPEGQRQLLALIQCYPASASASLAVLAHLRWLKAEQVDPLPWLDALLADATLRRADASKLYEQTSYARAAELEAQQRLAEARDAYLATATQFPYPQGALWDDALWHAAQLEAALGNPQAALSQLRRLLAEEEPANLQGSYERARFAQAHFFSAEILRDKLADALGAEREFQRIWDEHPTSLLRDDALWNIALLARAAGNEPKACSKLALIEHSSGGSRFLRCAHLICRKMRPAKRACPTYVRIP